MKNYVITTRSINEPAFKTWLGKGVKINIDYASHQLLRVLKDAYIQDSSILMGNTNMLLAILQDLDNQKSSTLSKASSVPLFINAF